MRKLRNLIGMPVLFNCHKIGRLVQADLSPDLKHLQGIWIDRGLKGTRYIPTEQLSMIGRHAVMADSAGVRKKCRASSLLMRAVSTDGNRLGAIVGAEVDELSFLVCALELTPGFWDDLHHPRRRIEHYCVQGAQVVITDSAQDFEREDEPCDTE